MNPKNDAIIYCQGAFNTPNGKTAHGLIRFTKRYKIISVIDSNYADKDAGEILDGKPNNIPVLGSLEEALTQARKRGLKPDYFIIGLAPDGGKMPDDVKQAVREAIRANMNIDSGLHDFLSDESDIVNLAKWHDVQLRDIRKPPERKELHFFTGKIEEVNALKIAILGTDSAIGKRTTAWILVNSLQEKGIKAELIGTGQTAWMQGAEYSIIFDSLVNDFVTGEIENAVWRAWRDKKPDVIVIEGQGSLLNPAYPGGYEIIAAGRPDLIIIQHAPARKEYDGFPGYKLDPLEKQIKVIELISNKPVVAVTLNHEHMTRDEVKKEIEFIKTNFGLPAFDLLWYDSSELIQLVISKLSGR